jgi:hypothetical protein
MKKLSKKHVFGLAAMALVVVGLATGCSSSANTTQSASPKPTISSSVGNPAKGVLPSNSHGVIYQQLNASYPQARKFAADFRKQLPELSKGSNTIDQTVILNGINVCTYIKQDPTMKFLKGNQSWIVTGDPNTKATAAQGKTIINLAIDDICPVYKSKKL